MATITGTAAGESLTGTRFQDEIFGLDGDDRIYARGGNDTIDGGTGRDFMAGRTGSDFYYVDTRFDIVAERLDEGESDTVFATVSFRLRENVENLELRGAATRGHGNDLANRLTVEAGQDVDNVLNGRGGADFMAGGRGSDTYYVDHVGDTIEEFGQDLDTVYSTISFVLGGDLDPSGTSAYLEDLTLLGGRDIDGTGGAFANTIRGNSGDNALYGLGGNDALAGLGGNDSLYGGAGRNVMKGGAGQDGFYFDTPVVYQAADRLTDFTPADDTIYLDTEFFDIPEGPLPESAFATYNAGQPNKTAETRILYDQNSGSVLYDPDGWGPELAVTFIIIVDPGSPMLTASDFVGY
jgi:Ca2+-binding RTX toxin-like protein